MAVESLARVRYVCDLEKNLPEEKCVLEMIP